MRPIIAALPALAFFGSTVALAQQPDFSKVEIKTQPTRGGVYMLEGPGGNIGLLVGADGALIVDDQFAPLSEKIMAAVNAVSPEPVAVVVNTHWHGDHTGGNGPFAAAGAMIIAHDNVRARMKSGLKRETRDTPPAAPEALPVATFSDAATLYWNGEEVAVIHTAPAHTDGDSLVLFRNANVLHMGDNFFRDGYPYLDLASGGDLDGAIAAQERALSLINDETIIIPGHGPLSNKADLAATVAMLRDMRARVQKLVDRGLSEDAVVKAKPLADLDDQWGKSWINGEDMTRTAYQSLTRKKAQ